MSKFLQKGWVVLLPFGDNQRYDMVIDRGLGFEKIQVKTGRLRNGVIIFETCSSYSHRGRKKKSYVGQVDFFAVYCPDNQNVYLVPIQHLGISGGSLRLIPFKTKRNYKCLWAKDFII